MSTWTVAWRVMVPLALLALGLLWFLPLPPALAYPPGVGILGKARNCLACHANDGPWKDDANLVVDILDKETGESLRQRDGSFLIPAEPERRRTVLIVLGRAKGDTAPTPLRNGWIFVDPALINRDHLGSKFAPGWEADLSMSCRLVGDTHKAYEGAKITVLPMTLRPTGAAKDGEVDWQILMTSGEAVKGDAKRGLVQNYFERKVRLKVEEQGNDSTGRGSAPCP
jgi:hypothetical protein